jgi:hypothetical protein
MKELVKKQDLETALQEEIAGGGRSGPLLKFDANTSKYTIDKNEVPVGRKFIVHIPQYARGWVLFRDKCPVEYKVHQITDGKPPDRKELDSPIADSDDDGWVYQRYLPLEDYDTSELITFVSKSTGAKIAIENLIQAYMMGRHRGGLPIICLAISDFRTREFGRKPRPDFKLIGWTSDNTKAPVIDEEGPPPTADGDPGYDLLNLSR